MKDLLIISTVGSNSLHENWIGEHDTILICYKPQSHMKYRDAGYPNTEVTFEPGTKFQLIYKHLQNKEDYRYYLFLDDDILITKDQINELLETAIRYNTYILHPSVNPQNCHHKILHPQQGNILRYTSWIEIQAPMFSNEALKDQIETFKENKTGWGLPNLWFYQNANIHTFAVADQITVFHSRPYGAGGLYNIEEANKEYFDLKEKYNIPDVEIETIGRVIKSCLSVCILYHDGDKKYIPDCVESLPNDAEIILMKTIPGKEWKIGEILENGLRKHIELEYPENEFHFAKARNYCKSFATREWILSLDADERLASCQHEELNKLLWKVNPDVWGLFTQNNGMIPTFIYKEAPVRIHARQCRLFRNKNIEWYGSVHETIERDIYKKEKLVTDCNIQIIHVGYEISLEDMTKKLERNVRIMLKNACEALEDSHCFKVLLKDCRTLNELRER